MNKQIKIKMLKAGKGDCIIVSWEDSEGEHTMVIDTGVRKSVKFLLDETIGLKKIDAIFITHFCNDHVGGAIKLLKDEEKDFWDKVRKIYVNSVDTISTEMNGDASVSDGIKFIELLKKNNISERQDCCLVGGDFKIGDAVLTILSPSVEDECLLDILNEMKSEMHKSGEASGVGNEKLSIDELFSRKLKKHPTPNRDVLNASSMAFALSIHGKLMLFLGDSHPEKVLEEFCKKELGPKVDLIKLSHHGSQRNITEDFINSIKCEKFLISTDGSSSHFHPDAITLSKIFCQNRGNEQKSEFYFNYSKSNYLSQLGEIFAEETEYENLNFVFEKEVVI